MTLHAGGVTRKHRSDAVIRALMAEGAVLCLSLVFHPCVIEWRCALDYRRFFDIEWRRRGRLRSWLRRFRGFIGSRLLGAAASKCADEKNRRCRDDGQSYASRHIVSHLESTAT